MVNADSFNLKNNTLIYRLINEKKTFVMSLKILVVFLILYVSKAVRSYEFLSISDEQIPFTIDVCKLYRQNSAILLYDESEKGKHIARFHYFFFFISTTFFLFFFRNGNGNDDVQMEA